MKSYNFKKDIKTIREVFELSQSSFSEKVGLSRSNIIRYEKGEIEPHKNALEKVYSFAYNNGLNLNKAKEMLYQDEKKNNILLIHGAKEVIKNQIDKDHLNGTKDFGAGFYLGLTLDSAASWVAERNNGTCYCFYLPNSKKYKILKLDVTKEWMYLVLYFRGAFQQFEINDEILNLVKQVNESDLLIAPIADNNMYETLNSFAYGSITDEQCLHALSANNLGLQYVLKSKNVIDDLIFVDHLYLCEEEKKRYLSKKHEYSLEGKSKADIAISEYRRKGKFFDELFKKKNG